MMDRRLMGSIGFCAVLATGCTADVADDTMAPDGQNEVTASVEQAEVLTNCPDAAEIPTVKINQELLINDLSVVNDSNNSGCRTSWEQTGCSTTTKNRWHFWHLMQQLAGTNNTNMTKFVLRWLESIETWSTPVNGYMLQARSKIRLHVIDPWMLKSNNTAPFGGCTLGVSINDPVNANCKLDPASAPLRLLAIVNRTDLRAAGNPSGYSTGAAGEGRIVFGFINQTTGAPIQATVIFEYKLPTRDLFNNPGGWTPLKWAQNWHLLGGGTVFGSTYNAQLQTITDQFVMAGKNPGGFNSGSAISQVRLNDRDFDPTTPSSKRQWSLREFKLGCYPGIACSTNDKFLVPAPVTLSPDNSHNNQPLLDDYLNSNASAILTESHTVPADYTFNGTTVPFSGAESKSNPLISAAGAFFWSNFDPLADANTEPDVRRLFALGTCNGCHYFETQTNNLHIAPRPSDAVAALSPFLSTSPTDMSGLITLNQDAAGNDVFFNEPRRRVCEFLNLLHGRATLLSNTSGRGH